jgi:HEAT repeat protein
MPIAEKTQLQKAVEELRSADPKSRAAAAKTLLSAGLREFSGVRKEVLSSDEAWNVLLHALSDSDGKVVENASGALAQVIGRYRRELTAFGPMRALLTHKNKQIRIFAVRGLAHLDHPERWTALMPLLGDKVEAVRKEVVLAMVNHAKDMSPADRVRAKDAMEGGLEVGGAELKMITENAIRVLASTGS